MADNGFEQELKVSMRRVAAPEKLAKFLALAAEAEEVRKQRGGVAFVRLSNGGKVIAFPRRVPAWIGGAVAAALVAGIFVTGDVRARHERERATAEFAASERIETAVLERVREQVEKAGGLE